MSFATFRACVMICALACGVSNIGAMQEGVRDSQFGGIPGFEPFSKAFIEGHQKVFALMVRETAQLPSHSREWKRRWSVDFAQNVFASIFHPTRIEPLSFEEEQEIVLRTKKRMRDYEILASRVVDDVIDWCIREQEAQIKRAHRDFASDTDDF
jgi:hypothetical protein